MPFLGKTPAQGFVNSVTKDDFTPNGTTTAFTLSKAPATVNEIEVYVGNVRQEPTDAYSVSGTTLTMTEAPATNTNFYVMHIGGTTQSSTTLPGGSSVPGALSVSGDLTVDTSTLKVDSTNNRVGIGTSTPTNTASGYDGGSLHIHNQSGSGSAIRLTNSTTGSGTSDGLLISKWSDSKTYITNFDNAAETVFNQSNSSGTLLPTLKLDGLGQVTKPSNIRFSTYLVGNQTGYDGYTTSTWGTQYIKFTQEEYDIGGGYQNSGSNIGKFIAPVAGTYYFQTSVYGTGFAGSTGWGQGWFNVNGGRPATGDYVVSADDGSGGAFFQMAMIDTIAAGDVVTVHPYPASNSSTNVTILANLNHTWFKGYLLG